MAITLLDVARLRKDDFEGGVIETWAQECDISQKLPLETIGTVEVRSRRTNSIATVGFRKRGEAYGAVLGAAHDDVADAVYAMGGTIDIDFTDFNDKALVSNPLTDRVEEGTKALAWKFNETFINGDHGTDEDEFEGIKVRLANSPAAQTIYAEDADNDLAMGTAISANTTATLQDFLDKLDDAVYSCDGHTADVCLTTSTGLKGLRQVKRRLGLSKDNLDPMYTQTGGSNQRRSSTQKSQLRVEHYNGVDFFDMGLDHDQDSDIIGTETIGGVACTPYYFLKLGKPYFHGIQQYAMRVTKPTLLEDAVTYRVVVDWPVGLRNVHPKSGAQLRGSAF